MTRVNLIVEGQTEETFVKELLSKHLSVRGVYPRVRRVETRRKGSSIFRGGMTTYAKAKNDITRWMRQDNNDDVRFTTMFDLYALPRDFPGYGAAMSERDPYQMVSDLEEAFKTDVGDPRFIPYLQLHEFEALLLADPTKLEIEFFEDSNGIKQLSDLVSDFESPELINLGRETAPSKRIIHEIPAYKDRKVSSGPIVASAIGLPTLRARCMHFDQWPTRLESLNETDLFS